MYKLAILFLVLICLSCESKEFKIARESIERNPKSFFLLPKEFQTNKELALLAIEKSPKIISFIDILLKEDEDFIIQAIERNMTVYSLLPDRLKNNAEIINAYKTTSSSFIQRFVNSEMVFIKGGSFVMGSEDGEIDEKPTHKVTLKDFYMSKTEVTVGQYKKCVEAGICSELTEECNFGFSDRDNHPINCITWKQARTFAKWVGGDLPTEAQWEYASRSEGKDIKYPWGNTNPTCDNANFEDCNKETTPVCNKTNGNTEQGLCDMAGNVWEWVLDEWHDSYIDAPNDGRGWCSDSACESNTSVPRVRRGGGATNEALRLRTTRRRNDPIEKIATNVGFRVFRPSP